MITIKKPGAPTVDTIGQVGQHYINLVNGDEYECVKIDDKRVYEKDDIKVNPFFSKKVLAGADCQYIWNLMKAGGGSGGVKSWNDLEDKPFYVEEKILADWGGNVEGLETAWNGEWYRISEEPITPDYLSCHKYTVLLQDGSVVELSSDFEKSGIIRLGAFNEWVIRSIYTEDLAEMVDMPIGVYILVSVAPNVVNLTSSRTKYIDSRVLPDAGAVEKGMVSLSEVADYIINPFEFYQLSDSITYREATEWTNPYAPGRFKRIEYGGITYLCYLAKENGFYGLDSSGQFIYLFCIDPSHSALKTITLTFPYKPDDNQTPTSITVTP